MPDATTWAGLFWTNYAPVLLAFTGGVIMFRYRHHLKLQREELAGAKEEGQTLAKVISIDRCQEARDDCKAAHTKRFDAILDIHSIDSKEVHGRITELSEQFYETRGALTEAVRAVKEGVVASKEAANKAQDAAEEAKGIAGEARILIETIKKVNGYGRES